MGILTMFWIEVKLIPTLWILAAISLPSFIIVNRALVSIDITLGEYRAKGKRD